MKFSSKRKAILLIIGIPLLTAMFLVLWAFVIEPNRVVVKQVEIKLPAWPSAFQNLRIVAVSDIHGGSRYIDRAKLDLVVAQINQTQPDCVVLLGDFVTQDEQARALMEPDVIANSLKNLRARYGVYAVMGNHDWWYGGLLVTRALSAAGIRVLENDVATIQKDGQTIWLLGVPDAWTRQPIDVSIAMQKINSPGPVIALTHNPDVFPTLPSNIILTLAGHTHGGQVSIPFIGRPIVPSKYKERYAIGYIQENNRHLFVTPGIGTTGIAVRFRVPPEISVLTISAD